MSAHISATIIATRSPPPTSGRPGWPAGDRQASQETLRVDVDRHLDPAVRARGRGEKRAQESLQVGRARRLDGEAKAVALAQNRDRRFGRAEQGDLVGLRFAAERRHLPACACGQAVRRSRKRPGMRLSRALVFARDDDCGEPPERRQAADAPLLGLFAVEPLGVARNERGDDRMLRLPRLQQGKSFALAPPGPPGRLAQELKGALRGARIGVGEADIGVDHADEGEERKIVALGDKLGADDEVELAVRGGGELPAQGLDSAGEVRRQGERADLGEEMRRFFGKSLDAWPTGGQAVDVVAYRADFWPQFDVAAMVADEGGAEAVLDEPRRAVGAFEPMPARAPPPPPRSPSATAIARAAAPPA